MKIKNLPLTESIQGLTGFGSLSCSDWETGLASGVTGNEHDLLDGEEKTLLRENDLEVEGLSAGMSDFGMFEKIKHVFSASWDEDFGQKLF